MFYVAKLILLFELPLQEPVFLLGIPIHCLELVTLTPKGFVPHFDSNSYLAFKTGQRILKQT